MLQPIYNQEVTGRLAFQVFDNNSESHSGLWFDRFYTYERYDKQGELLSNSQLKDAKITEKKSFWRDFQGVNGVRRCGNIDMLKKHALRQYALCEAQGGQSKVYANDWLMAIGLGNSHPLENGLLWHPTLGVPYFQGSTVKGLAKALMEKWGADPELIKRWFGSVNLLTSPNLEQQPDLFVKYFDTQLTEKLKETLSLQSTGAFIFLDAIPVEPVMIKEAMVTPHYGKWYEEGDSNPTGSDNIPGDWHSPVPVEFLAVENAVMQFGVMPRLGAKIKEGEIEQVCNVIELALQHLGIGAKTATGFGRMHENERLQKGLVADFEVAQQEAAEQKALNAELEGASELKQQLVIQMIDENWKEENDTAKTEFTKAVDEWLDKLEANPDDKDAIELMIEVFKIHYATQFKKPNKIKKERQKVWVERLKALQQSS
ncbi:type III-B CRISPR module RAMP protein Cmr6 [Psychrobacter lutiphocae]|uniref:type III-B CRISPR module RAMP protein Cmr6 n=1 Tax=Psychrobacter lutiphocae TaxID=540500 RepID=UPI00036342BD|nr:type III-B CRISPR module RAMP protein Cmr6 [Psychrobacter lutiphocae]